MATFERIAAGKAPPPPATTRPTALQTRMREFEGYAAELEQGEVGVLEPENQETTRALAMRLSRAGQRIGRNIESWPHEGKLYFRVDGPGTKGSQRFELGKKPAK